MFSTVSRGGISPIRPGTCSRGNGQQGMSGAVFFPDGVPEGSPGCATRVPAVKPVQPVTTASKTSRWCFSILAPMPSIRRTACCG